MASNLRTDLFLSLRYLQMAKAARKEGDFGAAKYYDRQAAKFADRAAKGEKE